MVLLLSINFSSAVISLQSLNSWDVFSVKFYCAVNNFFNITNSKCVTNFYSQSQKTTEAFNTKLVSQITSLQNQINIINKDGSNTTTIIYKDPLSGQSITYLQGPTGPMGPMGPAGPKGDTVYVAASSTPQYVYVPVSSGGGGTGATGPAGPAGTNGKDGSYITLITQDASSTIYYLFDPNTNSTSTIIVPFSASSTGTVSTSTISALITNSLSSSGNVMTSDVNGKVSSTTIINSHDINYAGGILTSTVNGVSATTSIAGLQATTTNFLSSAFNLLTSSVNGVTSTANIINSNIASSSQNLLEIIINGVSSGVTTVIKTFTQSISGNILTTNINGLISTSSVITSSGLYTNGTTLTTVINGVATSTDLANLVASSTSNTLNISTSTNTFTLISIVNGKTATTTGQIINQNSLGLSGNILSSNVNGIIGTSTVIGSSTISANAGVVTTNINGVIATTSVANLFIFLASSTNSNLTVSTTTSGQVIYQFSDTPTFSSSTITTLSSTNANLTNATATNLSINGTTSINGDLVLSNSAKATIANLASGSTTNSLSSSQNVLTSIVNGKSATTSLITSNLASSSQNFLETIVNGVSSGMTNIINSFTQSVTGNILTTTINGVSATTSVISNNALTYSTSTNTFTSSVNGVSTNGVITGLNNITLFGTTTATNLLSTTVKAITGLFDNLFFGSATGTNITATGTATINNLVATTTNTKTLNASTSNVGTLTVTGNTVLATTTISNLYAPVGLVNNLNFNYATATSLYSDIVRAVTGLFDNLFFGSATGTNITATGTATINNLVATTTNTTNLNSTNTNTSNLTSASTTLNGNTVISGSLDLSNASVTLGILDIPITNDLSSNDNTMTSVVNGVTSTANIINSNQLSYSSTTNVLSSIVNGILSTSSINGFTNLTLFGTTTATNLLSNTVKAISGFFDNLFFGSATGTNITATGTAYLNNIVATSANIQTLSSNQINTQNLVASETVNTNNLVASTGTITTLQGSTANFTDLLAQNAVFYNLAASGSVSILSTSTSNNVVATTGAIAHLMGTNIVYQNANFNTLNASNTTTGDFTATGISNLNSLIVTGTSSFSVLPTMPLQDGKILIGNSSNISAPQTISGDATLSNTGLLTLSNTGVTAGIYGNSNSFPIFTIDSKGRVTGASSSPIITSNVSSSSGNLFQTIVNGLPSNLSNIINSFTQTVTGNVLSTNINGLSATSSLINSNTFSYSTTTGLFTSTVNGVVATTTFAAAAEPWFDQATGVGATSNTQNIYQMGSVSVGTNALPTFSTGALRGITIDSGTASTSGLRLTRFSALTSTSTSFASAISAPKGVAIDAAGNIYTANSGSHDVTKITPTGVKSIFGSTGNTPVAIVVDSLGNIYTVNSASDNVTKITPQGVVTTPFASTGLNPQAITIDSADNLYVANYGSNSVTKITPSGAVSTFGPTGAGPTFITVDNAGNIYTSNMTGNSVTKITPSGAVSTLASVGPAPSGIGTDASGNVYVVSYSASRVIKISPSGATTTLGTTGSSPFGLYVDAAGNVYTANSGSNTVTKITSAGSTSTLGITGSGPYSLAMDPSGNIYTANSSGNSVTKISNPDASAMTTDADGNVIMTSVVSQSTLTNSLTSLRNATLGNTWSLLGNGNTSPSLNFLGTVDANDLAFRTNNVEAMRITASGTVAIGTTTPDINAKLDVAGMIKTKSLQLTTGAASGSVLVSNASGTGSWINNNLIGPITVVNSSNLFSTGLPGTGAGVSTTTDSIFLGQSAGFGATAASYSNFQGNQAGYGATNANNSVFFGYNAGYFATSSNDSNFFGRESGYQAAAANNSNFFGRQSGMYATNASFSNLFGYQAGKTFSGNNIGSNNIIIGTNISLPNAATNSMNIGGVLFGTGFYNITTGNPSITPVAGGKIGIGTSTPVNSLSVIGAISQTFATNTLLKADVTGKLVPAISGVDFANATGSGDYIQNQSLADQNANFRISGNGGLLGKFSLGTTSQAAKFNMVNNLNTSDLYLVPSVYDPYTGVNSLDRTTNITANSTINTTWTYAVPNKNNTVLDTGTSDLSKLTLIGNQENISLKGSGTLGQTWGQFVRIEDSQFTGSIPTSVEGQEINVRLTSPFNSGTASWNTFSLSTKPSVVNNISVNNITGGRFFATINPNSPSAGSVLTATSVTALNASARVAGFAGSAVTVGDVTGLNVGAGTLSGAVSTNNYGIFVNNGYVNTGSTTNAYGLYLQNQTAGLSKNFSIYSEGATNYFGGNVGIGTSTPVNSLSVIGAISQTFATNTLLKADATGKLIAATSSDLASYYTDTLQSVTARGNVTTYPIFTSGLHINGPSGTYRDLSWRTNNLLRWDLYANTTAESGGNVGSELNLTAYDDAGNPSYGIFTASRANGQVTFAQQLNAAGGNSTQWNTAYSWGNHATAGYALDYTVHHINASLYLNNDSASNTNKTWFDYNWASTSLSGSAINFSGLGGNYSTELFGTYNFGGNNFYLRTRNGDINTWNPVRRVWTDGDFTQTNVNNWNTLAGGTSGSYIQNQNSVDQTANFRISGNGTFNGKVGIGTSTPANALSVVGSISQTGVTGSLLKADATGKLVAAVSGTDYLAGSATSSFILNQSSPAQTANFNISGNGVIGGSLTASGVYAPSINVNGPSGSYRDLTWRTSGNMRWDLFADTTAESGGNAGSNLNLVSYADNGSPLNPVFSVIRSTGNINFSNKVGIGISTPNNKLEINSAVAGTSGLRFTQLTSSSATSTATGKVLSVNSLGDVILVNDLSGGGTATPAGASGDIQWNNGGSFAGGGLIYDSVDTILKAPAAATQLTVEQTGDSYGGSGFTLQNRYGNRGATFYTNTPGAGAGDSDDITNFSLKTSTGVQGTLSYTRYTGAILNSSNSIPGGNYEGVLQLQIGNTPYYEFGSSVSQFDKPLFINSPSTNYAFSTNGSVGIGTTTIPTSAKLNVIGDTYIGDTGNTSGVSTVYVRGRDEASLKFLLGNTETGSIRVLGDMALDSPGGVSFKVSGANMMYLNSTGLSIGTIGASHMLDVGFSSLAGAVAGFTNSNGTCTINPTNTSLSCSSDINLKKNITNLEDDSTFSLKTINLSGTSTVLDKVSALSVVTYNWKNEADTAGKHTGFIAQDMEQIFPDLVATDASTSLKSVSYAGMTPYLVAAMKELNVRVSQDTVFANVGSSTLVNNTIQNGLNKFSIFIASSTDMLAASTSLANLESLFSTSSLASIKALTNTLTQNDFSLNLNANAIVNIKSLESASHNWSINDAGLVTAKFMRAEGIELLDKDGKWYCYKSEYGNMVKVGEAPCDQYTSTSTNSTNTSGGSTYVPPMTMDQIDAILDANGNNTTSLSTTSSTTNDTTTTNPGTSTAPAPVVDPTPTETATPPTDTTTTSPAPVDTTTSTEPADTVATPPAEITTP